MTTPISQIESRLEAVIDGSEILTDPTELLAAGESVLENWILAKSLIPTTNQHEGFRLLALQRQGAIGDPSFNACRETCRELVYHYNLVNLPADEKTSAKTLQMMVLITNHLCLFVSGKMQEAALGEFCCSSKPLRADQNIELETIDAHS